LISLEHSGTKAAVVTTEQFIGLGRMQATGLGLPLAEFVVIPHPFGDLKPADARERGREVARELLARERAESGSIGAGH
jgi:hypothetical protein